MSAIQALIDYSRITCITCCTGSHFDDLANAAQDELNEMPVYDPEALALADKLRGSIAHLNREDLDDAAIWIEAAYLDRRPALDRAVDAVMSTAALTMTSADVREALAPFFEEGARAREAQQRIDEEDA